MNVIHDDMKADVTSPEFSLKGWGTKLCIA